MTPLKFHEKCYDPPKWKCTESGWCYLPQIFPATYEGKRAQSKHKFGFQGCLIKGGWSSFLFCDFLRMITDDDADPLEYHNWFKTTGIPRWLSILTICRMMSDEGKMKMGSILIDLKIDRRFYLFPWNSKWRQCLYFAALLVPPFPVKSDVILHFSGIMKKWIIMMMILRLAGKIKTFKIQGLNTPIPLYPSLCPVIFFISI